MVALGLASGRPTCRDDADDVAIAFGPDDEYEAPLDGADGDEPVFEVGVELVKDLEDLHAVGEEFRGLIERDAILDLVGLTLGFIPLELRRSRVSQWLTKSMAWSQMGRSRASSPSSRQVQGALSSD